ncbi:MAG: RlmE family RNA methyltransferase [Rickettsiaceae bacterium]|nr:RlmE family RNA methyltransferase [Rickettsiaceae bacterium]
MRLKFTKLKTAKKRTSSSAKWLQRQLNDEFVEKAKFEGYRSRAAYKLIEIDEKFNLIKEGLNIIDLGAAPGGWSQVISRKTNGTSKIIALDLLEMGYIEHVDFIQGDFCDSKIHDELLSRSVAKSDLILSDMAPNTTGHKTTDHLRIINLCEYTLEFALKSLNQNGSLVLKIFQGGAHGDFFAKIKKNFTRVKHFKPKASARSAAEMYLIAQGFRSEA